MSSNEYRILAFLAEQIVGELTAYRLKLLGMAPVLVTTEEQMQAEIEDSLPSLMILDLDLTEIDAMAVIESWASNEVTSRIPVLCMSAEGDLGKAERAFAAGAREYVVLPYDPIVMENKVLNLLDSAAESKDESHSRPLASV